MGNAEHMGSSGDDITSHRTSWLSLDSRRRKSTPSNSPLTSMTSREMARLMPSMQATSSVLATCTQLSRPSKRSEANQRRARRCSPRLTCSPCTRPARTQRTRVDSMTLLMMMASCLSFLSWKRCALLRSKPDLTYCQYLEPDDCLHGQDTEVASDG